MSVWPWPFDPKVYRCLTFFVLRLCKNYVDTRLKTVCVIATQLSVQNTCTGYVTLTFWPSKKQGVFLSSSFICVWSLQLETFWFITLQLSIERICNFDLEFLIQNVWMSSFLCHPCLYEYLGWKLFKSHCNKKIWKDRQKNACVWEKLAPGSNKVQKSWSNSSSQSHWSWCHLKGHH